MKILIISNLYPPFVRGGAELVAQRMAEGLRDSLQHVVVVTSEPFSSLKSLRGRWMTVNDVSVFRFYPVNVYHYLRDHRFPWIMRAIWHFIDIFNVHSYWMIRHVIMQEQPDVVITHNLMGIGFLTPRVIHRLRVPHVHVLHDVQLYEPSGIIVKGNEHTFLSRVYRIIGYHLLMRWLFAKVKIVISPSNFLGKFYQERGYFKDLGVTILPYPVVPPDPPIAHTEGSRLRLLYVGQLTHAKGIEGLTQLVKSLPEGQIELKVVGSGPLFKNIQHETKHTQHIRTFGWIAPEAMRAVLGDSDVLVFPTLCYDNSPNVVFEALSAGIPVITSDIGGAQEIVVHDFNGWIFKTGDWHALERRILALMHDPRQVSDAARNARPSIEHLSPAIYFGKLLDLIQT